MDDDSKDVTTSIAATEIEEVETRADSPRDTDVLQAPVDMDAAQNTCSPVANGGNLDTMSTNEGKGDYTNTNSPCSNIENATTVITSQDITTSAVPTSDLPASLEIRTEIMTGNRIDTEVYTVNYTHDTDEALSGHVEEEPSVSMGPDPNSTNPEVKTTGGVKGPEEECALDILRDISMQISPVNLQEDSMECGENEKITSTCEEIANEENAIEGTSKSSKDDEMKVSSKMAATKADDNSEESLKPVIDTVIIEDTTTLSGEAMVSDDVHSVVHDVIDDVEHFIEEDVVINEDEIPSNEDIRVANNEAKSVDEDAHNSDMHETLSADEKTKYVRTKTRNDAEKHDTTTNDRENNTEGDLTTDGKAQTVSGTVSPCQIIESSGDVDTRKCHQVGGVSPEKRTVKDAKETTGIEGTTREKKNENIDDSLAAGENIEAVVIKETDVSSIETETDNSNEIPTLEKGVTSDENVTMGDNIEPDTRKDVFACDTDQNTDVENEPIGEQKQTTNNEKSTNAQLPSTEKNGQIACETDKSACEKTISMDNEASRAASTDDELSIIESYHVPPAAAEQQIAVEISETSAVVQVAESVPEKCPGDIVEIISDESDTNTVDQSETTSKTITPAVDQSKTNTDDMKIPTCETVSLDLTLAQPTPGAVSQRSAGVGRNEVASQKTVTQTPIVIVPTLVTEVSKPAHRGRHNRTIYEHPKGELKELQAIIHENRTVTEPTHQCPFCKTEPFAHEYVYRKHLRKAHQVTEHPYAYTCPFSEHKSWLFFHLGALQSHVTQFHVEFLKSQSICFERKVNPNFHLQTMTKRLAPVVEPKQKRSEEKPKEKRELEPPPAPAQDLNENQCPMCIGPLFRTEEALFRHMMFYHETKIPPYTYACLYKACKTTAKMHAMKTALAHLAVNHGEDISNIDGADDCASRAIGRFVNDDLNAAVIVANALRQNEHKETTPMKEREDRWKKLLPNARKVPVIYDPTRSLGKDGDLVLAPAASTSAVPPPSSTQPAKPASTTTPSTPPVSIVMGARPHRHIPSKHMSLDLVKCPKCDLFSTDEQALSAHMQSLHNIKMIQCTRCDKLLIDAKAFAAHMKDDHGFRVLKCNECDIFFKDEARLNEHLMKKHAADPLCQPGMYQCMLPLCNRRLHTIREAERHLTDFHRIQNSRALRLRGVIKELKPQEVAANSPTEPAMLKQTTAMKKQPIPNLVEKCDVTGDVSRAPAASHSGGVAGRSSSLLTAINSAFEHAMQGSRTDKQQPKLETGAVEIKGVDLQGVTIPLSDFKTSNFGDAKVLLTKPSATKETVEEMAKESLGKLPSHDAKTQELNAQSKKYIDRFSIAWDAPESVNLSSAMLINVNVNVTNATSQADPKANADAQASPKETTSGFTKCVAIPYAGYKAKTTGMQKTMSQPVKAQASPDVVCVISDDSDDNLEITDSKTKTKPAAKQSSIQRSVKYVPILPKPSATQREPTCICHLKWGNCQVHKSVRKSTEIPSMSDEQLKEYIMSQIERYKKPKPQSEGKQEPKPDPQNVAKGAQFSKAVKPDVIKDAQCDKSGISKEAAVAQPKRTLPKRHAPRRYTYLSRGAYRESDQSDNSGSEDMASTSNKRRRKKSVDATYKESDDDDDDDANSTASGEVISSDEEWLPGETEFERRMRKRKRFNEHVAVKEKRNRYKHASVEIVNQTIKREPTGDIENASATKRKRHTAETVNIDCSDEERDETVSDNREVSDNTAMGHGGITSDNTTVNVVPQPVMIVPSHIQINPAGMSGIVMGNLPHAVMVPVQSAPTSVTNVTTITSESLYSTLTDRAIRDMLQASSTGSGNSLQQSQTQVDGSSKSPVSENSGYQNLNTGSQSDLENSGIIELPISEDDAGQVSVSTDNVELMDCQAGQENDQSERQPLVGRHIVGSSGSGDAPVLQPDQRHDSTSQLQSIQYSAHGSDELQSSNKDVASSSESVVNSRPGETEQETAEDGDEAPKGEDYLHHVMQELFPPTHALREAVMPQSPTSILTQEEPPSP